MRAFGLAVLTLIVLGVLWSVGLNEIQKDVATAFSTSGVRLDQQESVDNMGRQPPAAKTAG